MDKRSNHGHTFEYRFETESVRIFISRGEGSLFDVRCENAQTSHDEKVHLSCGARLPVTEKDTPDSVLASVERLMHSLGPSILVPEDREKFEESFRYWLSFNCR